MLENSNYINRFIYFSSFLVFFIPFAQVTGPFLTDLIISTTALMYIFIILIFNKRYHEHNNFLNILIVFWLYITFTSLLSEYKFLTIKPSFTFIRFIIFSFLVIYLAKNNKNFLKNFNVALLIVLFFVILDGYIQFIFGKNLLGFEKVRPDRISGLFLDELILGSYLSKFLPIILFFYYENRFNKKIKNFNIIIILAMLPLIFLSGERSAFFLSLLFILLVLPIILSFKKFLIFIIMFCSTAIVIINISPTIHDRYVNQLKDHIVIEKNGSKLYFPEHIGLFNSSYNNFLENKLIGSGVKSFRETCKLNNSHYKKEIIKIRSNVDFCSTHPHNYYLQFLSETGLVGFSILVFIFIYCVIKYIQLFILFLFNKQKNKMNKKKYIILLSGLLMHLWPITTTGNFFNNWNSSFLFLNLSLFLYFNDKFITEFKK